MAWIQVEGQQWPLEFLTPFAAYIQTLDDDMVSEPMIVYNVYYFRTFITLFAPRYYSWGDPATRGRKKCFCQFPPPKPSPPKVMIQRRDALLISELNIWGEWRRDVIKTCHIPQDIFREIPLNVRSNIWSSTIYLIINMSRLSLRTWWRTHVT